MMCLVTHLALITIVAVRDQFADVGQGYTWLPENLVRFSKKMELVTRFLLGDTGRFSYWQESVTLYLHSAGIESGYGYFAPNVPSNYKIVFELHYPDGHVEYELPQVYNAEAGLRLSSLLDSIGRTEVPLLREELLRMVTFSVWQRHPTAEMIRTVFGVLKLPAADDFVRGAKDSYQFLYAYDFRFQRNPPLP